jgi:MFS family permease
MSYTTPIAVQAPTGVRWRILAVLLAFSFMSWFNRVSMPAAYDEQIKDRLGITPEAIGYVYSALLFAYMLFMTPGGWFADRSGPWTALAVMGFGSALFVALTGVVGLATSATVVLVLLLVVRAALGVFTAPIYPASARVIAHWFPAPQRAAANGAVMAAALVGIAATYVGFGALLDVVDWPIAFLITGTATALIALLWAWFGRSDPGQHPGVNQAEIELIRAGHPAAPAGPPLASAGAWGLLRNRSLVLLTLSYAAIGYFEYLFYFWIHYYFEGVLHYGKEKSRWYTTVLSLAMAAGMLLGGWLADRLARSFGRRVGRAAVVMGGMFAGAVLLVLGVLTPTPELVVVCFALAMAAVGATEGPCWATAVELGGRHGGTAAGIFNTGGNAGGVLAPVLTPLVSGYFGWRWGITLGGLVCLAGLVLWLWIDPADRRHERRASLA